MKTLIALSAFLAAVLIAAFLLRAAGPDWVRGTPFARSENAADAHSALLTEFDVEEIARAWTAKSVNGAAGDEIAGFIAEESNAMQPDTLQEYLKPRLESATTWNYGQIARTGENRYEMTATATTRVHDMMEVEFTSSDQPKGARGETAQSPADFDVEYTRIVKMPFSLTVDLELNSVIDWQALRDEAGEAARVESDRRGDLTTAESLYGDAVAECVNAVSRRELPDGAAKALFLPPQEREGADAARLRAAVNSAGLGGVCEEWIGE